mgnify:FL=1
MSIDEGIAGFGLTELAADNKLHRILSAALGERGVATTPADVHSIYWEASYFSLDRVSIFSAASPLEQQQILHQLNQELLQESLSIEQAGVGYMAKMVLMAENAQERMLYSLFAADETTHLALLLPYGTPYAHPSDPFLQLLSVIVDSADKAVLLFVLQVVLEGWGLTHYRQLARGCCDRTLKSLFQSFLQAEARHHGTGITLFNQTDLSVSSQAAIVDCLATFLQMVRVGPQRVLGAIATHIGPLSRPQRIRVLRQLNTAGHAHQRLQLLRSLMFSASHDIVERLEHQGLFSPLSPEEAASYG